MLKQSLVVLMLLVVLCSFGQSKIEGIVSDESGKSIGQVSVQIQGSRNGAVTDKDGRFLLKINTTDSVNLVFSHVQYESQLLRIDLQSKEIVNVILKERTTELEGVEVRNELEIDEVQSVVKIDAKSARSLPSAFGDFNKILVTLPGVSNNNELSSAYSVRGGNFDENLVYVNDIPVYRPFLSNAGRQEGLSFVNPDMVQDIEFYAGGWEAKYGDKLSSSLNIEYKEPSKEEGGAMLGLLGGTIYYGGQNGRLSHLTGIRHKDSRYLLNTLKTKGQYFPTYTDIQSLLTFDLSKKNSSYINRTKLNLLFSYGRNRYLTRPISQDTQFGSIQANFRLQTAFEGQESLNYDTYQTGLRLTHRVNNRFRTHLIGSGMYTYEREQFDVEGAYRLCDVEMNSGEEAVDCASVRGIGTNYNYGRNALRASLFTIENRNEYLISGFSTLEWGAGLAYQSIHDNVNEYSFLDSADYITVNNRTFNSIDMSAVQYFAFVQNTIIWGDSVHAINFGGRINYWDFNGQLLFSPRVSYRLSPKWKSNTTLKFSVGLYQQPPFYRELRDYNGRINNDILAQKSIHFIAGYTNVFYMWGRPFLFNSDAYFKKLFDIIPYDIDNLKIRYYPTNNAVGYATGFDFRVNGEFVKGTQSWLSVGFLQTKENLKDDTYTTYFDKDGVEIQRNMLGRVEVAKEVENEVGYVRRPSDQRLNIAIYFEDHMPRDPSARAHLNLVFGSGYPFGAPKAVQFRNNLKGDRYYRVDIGFSKAFDRAETKLFPSVVLRAEILNALGADNTMSYSWIQDVYGNYFAVPNSLSARFLNIKISAQL
jgi:hypothetical protein